MLPDSLLVHPNCQTLRLHVAADSVAKKLMSYEGIG